MGRFPTEKAYGVTTNGTIRALVKLGHEVTVCAIESTYAEEMPRGVRVVSYRETSLSKFLKNSAFANSTLINVVFWKIYWKLLIRTNRNILESFLFDVVWIRDITMLNLRLPSKKFILEIHQKIKVHSLIARLDQEEIEKVVLAPISKSLVRQLDSLKNTNYPVVYSPMGIDASKIASEKEIDVFLKRIDRVRSLSPEKIRVGYVGKFFPNGYSKGIEDLVLLTSLLRNSNERFDVSISGGLPIEIQTILSFVNKLKLSSQDIEIKPHMSHSEALSRMRYLDVIVLPRPYSSSYVGFPLKCIEAVASARIVVAAKCDIYEDIFNNSYSPYWYTQGDPESLLAAINSALQDPNLRQKIGAGVQFARLFSWELRTQRLMRLISD